MLGPWAGTGSRQPSNITEGSYAVEPGNGMSGTLSLPAADSGFNNVKNSQVAAECVGAQTARLHSGRDAKFSCTSSNKASGIQSVNSSTATPRHGRRSKQVVSSAGLQLKKMPFQAAAFAERSRVLGDRRRHADSVNEASTDARVPSIESKENGRKKNLSPVQLVMQRENSGDLRRETHSTITQKSILLQTQTAEYERKDDGQLPDWMMQKVPAVHGFVSSGQQIPAKVPSNSLQLSYQNYDRFSPNSSPNFKTGSPSKDIISAVEGTGDSISLGLRASSPSKRGTTIHLSDTGLERLELFAATRVFASLPKKRLAGRAASPPTAFRSSPTGKSNSISADSTDEIFDPDQFGSVPVRSGQRGMPIGSLPFDGIARTPSGSQGDRRKLDEEGPLRMGTADFRGNGGLPLHTSSNVKRPSPRRMPGAPPAILRGHTPYVNNGPPVFLDQSLAGKKSGPIDTNMPAMLQVGAGSVEGPSAVSASSDANANTSSSQGLQHGAVESDPALKFDASAPPPPTSRLNWTPQNVLDSVPQMQEGTKSEERNQSIAREEVHSSSFFRRANARPSPRSSDAPDHELLSALSSGAVGSTSEPNPENATMPHKPQTASIEEQSPKTVTIADSMAQQSCLQSANPTVSSAPTGGSSPRKQRMKSFTHGSSAVRNAPGTSPGSFNLKKRRAVSSFIDIAEECSKTVRAKAGLADEGEILAAGKNTAKAADDLGAQLSLAVKKLLKKEISSLEFSQTAMSSLNKCASVANSSSASSQSASNSLQAANAVLSSLTGTNAGSDNQRSKLALQKRMMLNMARCMQTMSEHISRLESQIISPNSQPSSSIGESSLPQRPAANGPQEAPLLEVAEKVPNSGSTVRSRPTTVVPSPFGSSKASRVSSRDEQTPKSPSHLNSATASISEKRDGGQAVSPKFGSWQGHDDQQIINSKSRNNSPAKGPAAASPNASDQTAKPGKKEVLNTETSSSAQETAKESKQHQKPEKSRVQAVSATSRVAAIPRKAGKNSVHQGDASIAESLETDSTAILGTYTDLLAANKVAQRRMQRRGPATPFEIDQLPHPSKTSAKAKILFDDFDAEYFSSGTQVRDGCAWTLPVPTAVAAAQATALLCNAGVQAAPSNRPPWMMLSEPLPLTLEIWDPLYKMWRSEWSIDHASAVAKQTGDLTPLVGAVCEACKRFFEADEAKAWFLNDESRARRVIQLEMECRYDSRPLEVKEAEKTSSTDVTSGGQAVHCIGLAGACITKKQMLLTENAQKDAQYNRMIDGQHSQKMIVVPVMSNSGLSIGCISVTKQSGPPFHAASGSLMSLMCSFVAQVVDHLVSVEQSKILKDKLLALQDATLALGRGGQSLVMVLRRFSGLVQRAVGCERCYIWIKDTDNKHLLPVGMKPIVARQNSVKKGSAMASLLRRGGSTAGKQSDITGRLKIGSGAAGYVVATGKYIQLADAYHDRRFDSGLDDMTGFKTKAVLGMPLKNMFGEVIGVIEGLNKEGAAVFNNEDKETLDAMGIQAAALIERHKLYQNTTWDLFSDNSVKDIPQASRKRTPSPTEEDERKAKEEAGRAMEAELAKLQM